MPDEGLTTPDLALRLAAKAHLRKQNRALRGAMPEEALALRSARIVERLLAWPVFSAARSVALFWPIERRHEVDLRALDGTARARGVRVAYPQIEPTTRRMTFRWVEDPGELLDRGLGFAEPDPLAPEVAAGELDLIVVPALAVDPTGHRVGYGAGYYDKALPRFAPPARTVSVAFDFQVIPEVPATDADRRVEAVATDERWIDCDAPADLLLVSPVPMAAVRPRP